MKKCYFLILLMALICFVLPASGEEIGYTIDVADEITVGLGETIHLPFERPYSSHYHFNAYCSDPEALKAWSEETPDKTHINTSLPVTGTFDVCFQKKGTFDLHITFQEREIRTISVVVDDLATKASVSQERFVLRAGETVNTGLTLENGAMYNLPTFTKGAYYDSFVQISEDGLTLKGISKGHMKIYVINPLKQELCQFEVVVVEETENVELSCPQEYAVVGKNLTLSAKSNGEEALPLVTITEGSDCVRWDGDSRVWSFYPFAPGWVTFTAYGTDGSTSSVRIRVLSGSDDMVYHIPKTTLTAGESMEVSILFPSDAWITMEIAEPAEQGLTGTVALLEGNRVTGVTAGVCNLVLHGVGMSKVIPITVTDSPRALTVIRPKPYMDVESSFQLSVQDKLGNVYPATFSQNGQNFTIGENGLITPNRAASGTLRATLENGAEFSFVVKAARFPKEFTCTVDEIVVPLNKSSVNINNNGTIGYIIYDELGAVSGQEIVVCSDDRSIVRTDLQGNTLYPQRIGQTTLTIWSLYCDVSIRVPIRITEPTDILYVDGKDYAVMEVPVGATMKLPTVTDYYGNPVKVTWKMDEATSTSAFRLVNKGTSVKVLTDSGSTYVTATSQTGATLRCTVQAYKRSENFTLSRDHVQLNTGSRGQIEIRRKVGTETEQGDGSMLYPDDVSYTLSGDVDCIQLEYFGPSGFRFVGMKPGTVTMTVKLYNGFSASCVIQVLLPTACQEGHDPVWKTEQEANAIHTGTERLRCSRCDLDLGQSRETPATGVISFCDHDIWLQPGQEIDLMTQLDGGRHYSFTWESSDPTVANVAADHLTVYDYGEATITAYAYDCHPGTCYVHVIDPNADMVAHGDRFNLHWTLDKDGLLTISGTGAMDDFELLDDRAAWHLYSSQIKRVVIVEGVTDIGANAFEFCGKFTEISIPNTVTVIGDNALNGCSSLTEIHVPASVTAIGERAFMDNGYLQAIHVDADNPVYSSLDGVLFSKDQRLLIQYPSAKADPAYTIPDGVAAIGSEAFRHCSNLTEITIPSGVTEIDEYAFSLCYGLKDVYYHGTEDDWAGIEVEYGNDDLLKANLHCAPDLVPQLILPASLTTIESEAFQGLPEGIVVFIPNAVTSIAEDAFDTGTVIVTPSGSFAAQWGREHGFEVHEQ